MIAKSGDGYSVSMTLGGYLYKISGPPDCAKSDLRDGTQSSTASFSDGKLVGENLTVTGTNLTGGWTKAIGGGSETVTLSAGRG